MNLSFAVYGAAMFYALASVTGAWAIGRRRGLSELQMVFGALGAPITGWLYSMYFPPAALLAPLAYVYLWQHARRRDESDEKSLAALDAEEFQAASARASVVSDDGAALMSLARLLEKEGRFPEALERYEEAHRVSDVMLGAEELKRIRERLERAARGESEDRGPLSPADWVVFAAGLAIMFDTVSFGLAILSTMAFARWLRSGPESIPT